MTKDEALEWGKLIDLRNAEKVARAVRDIARKRGWVGCHGGMWLEAETYFDGAHPQEYKELCEKYYRPINVCDPARFNFAERGEYPADLKLNYERAKGQEVRFYLLICERFFKALDAGQVRQAEEAAA